MMRHVLIATADFHTSAGPVTAGEPIAMIETELELGQISSLLRARHLVTVETEDLDPPLESEADATANDGPSDPAGSDAPSDSDEPTGDDAQPGDAPGNDSSDAPEGGADQPAADPPAAGGDDSPKLDKLIEAKPAKLLAAENVFTVADLKAWIAKGNHPAQLNGIGDVTEGEILEATKLSLPAPE